VTVLIQYAGKKGSRGKRGQVLNFANYSAGNPTVKQGIEYIKAKGEREEGIPTVAGFGSPVNTKDMQKTVEKVEFKFNGNVTKPNDFVGEGLGGNKGKNQQMSTKDRIKAITNAPKLFTNESPHGRKNYNCEDNPNAKLKGDQCGRSMGSDSIDIIISN